MVSPVNWSVTVACRHEALPNLTRDIQNCTAIERRRGTPLNASPIECGDIPDDAIPLATGLGTGKLLLQFLGDEMILVPELYDPWVRDSTLNHPTRFCPVGRQHGLPDDKNTYRY